MSKIVMMERFDSLFVKKETDEASVDLYEALLTFAYLKAGKLELLMGEYEEPMYPEDFSMTELLKAALHYFEGKK